MDDDRNANAVLSTAPVPKDETAWLIEAAGPKYWNGRSLGVESFSTQHTEAIRFARFEDGEVVRCRLLENINPLLVTREHKWMTPTKDAAAQSAA